MLTVARSSFYHWRDAASTPTELRRRRLGEQVASVFHAARGTYGCRRVAAALNRDGTACSVGLVAELMREQGLKACQPRAYKVTTIAGGQVWRRPDLLDRDFTSDRPGERLVGDITYLKTGEGWLYLATVIDLGNPELGQEAALTVELRGAARGLGAFHLPEQGEQHDGELRHRIGRVARVDPDRVG